MATFPSTSSAYGRWNLMDVRDAQMGGNWPSVVTVPGAPTIGTATGGNAQASVTFTAPASDGGSAITGYRVTSSPGGITATGASSPITITGLTNGTSYTFTVAAQNAIGYGAESASSNSVTPAAPAVWTRILNSAFTSTTTNSVSVAGYTNVLIFAVAPGGYGGPGGDDDGGGGGGSGAVQLTGFTTSLGANTSLSYTVTMATSDTRASGGGGWAANLTISGNSSGSIFTLKGGQNGYVNPSNSGTRAAGGSGGNSGNYSAVGVSGGAGATRSGSQTAIPGSSGATSGGGGGGAWLGDRYGDAGGSSTASSTTLTTYGGVSLSNSFSYSPATGGAANTTGGAGNNAVTAYGGSDPSGGGSVSGGSAGGGLYVNSSGSAYGGGGGGSAGYGGNSSSGGAGGGGYLVIYVK